MAEDGWVIVAHIAGRIQKVYIANLKPTLHQDCGISPGPIVLVNFTAGYLVVPPFADS